MVQKRYQHYTKDGIVWTPWFNTTYKDKDLKRIQKEDKWQLSPKLSNEFRIAQVEETEDKKKKEPKKKKK